MDEKLVTIEELKELREKITENKAEDNDYMKIFELFPSDNEEKIENTDNTDNTTSKENAYQFAKTNPSMPSLLDKKAGFSNVIYLATMSLVFEVVFLAVSFLIFN